MHALTGLDGLAHAGQLGIVHHLFIDVDVTVLIKDAVAFTVGLDVGELVDVFLGQEGFKFIEVHQILCGNGTELVFQLGELVGVRAILEPVVHHGTLVPFEQVADF